LNEFIIGSEYLKEIANLDKDNNKKINIGAA
jgi:hypothetical protein